MALKNGKINSLNALGIRKTNFPAHHFHYTELKKFTPTLLLSIDNWVYHNLNGRYYIGRSISLVDNSFIYSIKIGFENEKELSFFKLACPHLSY